MTFALQSTCVRLKMAGKSEDLVGNVLRHFFSLEQEGQCGSVRMLVRDCAFVYDYFFTILY